MLRRRPIAAMLLALHLTSCTFWTVSKTPLPELTGGDTPPALVRVVTIDGEKLELTDPRVHNDTLIGGAVPDTGWVFVALADITKVEVRKKDALKTGLAVVVVAGVVLALAALCKNPENCTTEDDEE